MPIVRRESYWERIISLSWGNVTIHDAIVPLKKSSRMITSLSEGECHNHTMKIVDYDLYTQIDKVATLN